MIAVGVLGLVSVVGFVAWVVLRDPWIRSRGAPTHPHAEQYAEQHAEELRSRRRLVTRRALDRLRDARNALDAVALSDGRGSHISL